MNSEPLSLAAALVAAIAAMATAVGILFRRLETVRDEHARRLKEIEADHQAELDKKDAELRTVERERLKAAEGSMTWALGLQAQHIDSVSKLAAVANALEKRSRGE